MGRLVPAVARAFDILELFAEAEHLSIPEIRDRLELPRTSVHELVNTLVERAYLSPVTQHEHRYELGAAVWQLGSRYAERVDLIRESQRAAAEVAARCGETTHVGVLEGTDVVYIAKAESTKPVRILSAVGRRLPAHCTGVGKALLAALTDDEFARRYAGATPLTALTISSITDPGQLKAQLADVRRSGLAYDEGESTESVCCVAAPVQDLSGDTIAAISIAVPSLRWDTELRQALAALVLQGAADLSRRLGHQSSS